jgi:hypothetical protein
MDFKTIRRRLRNRRKFAIALFAVVLVVFGAIGITTAFTGGSGWKRVQWGPAKQHPKRVQRADGTSVTTTTAPVSTEPTTTSATSSTTRATPTPVTPTGQFTETFDNLNNWTFAHWRSEIPGSADANSTVSIVNGQAQIVAADKNYGDATLRSNTKYALGEIRLTISDNSGGWPLLGSAFVGLTTDPFNAPSIKRDNGEGPTPANGVLIQMRDNCREPWAGPQGSVYVNHVETVVTAVCLGGQPTGPTELRVSNGHVEFWSAGAKYAEMNVAVPATGYLLLGVHNHASEKYSDGPGPMPAVIGLFDNVSYPSAGRTSSYRNGAGVTALGTSARVVFNAYAANTPVGAAVVVNGHSHPFTPYYPLSHSVAESVAIPVSDLVVGNNTITIVGGFTTIANIDLVIEGPGA